MSYKLVLRNINVAMQYNEAQSSWIDRISVGPQHRSRLRLRPRRRWTFRTWSRGRSLGRGASIHIRGFGIRQGVLQSRPDIAELGFDDLQPIGDGIELRPARQVQPGEVALHEIGQLYLRAAQV